MPPTLLPIPLRQELAVPEFRDLNDAHAFIRQLVQDYEQFRATVFQNTNRLASLPDPPEGAPDWSRGQRAGMGLGVSDLTGRYLNLSAADFRRGLTIANGADRGKVSVTFQYLGVGPNIVGSGEDVTYTADLAVSGAGGLDTGAEAADTWYYVYVIVGDDTGAVLDATGNNHQPPHWRRAAKVNVLLSASATAPTLPPGFTRFRRVSAVRNNASSDLYRFTYLPGAQCYEWNEDVAATPFLVLSVTTSAVAYTDVSCASVAPSVCRMLKVNLRAADGIACSAGIKNKDNANIVYGGMDRQVLAPANQALTNVFDIGCDASQVVQYRTGATTTDVQLSVHAWYDAI